ncbi:hypothetical protein K501DRAFT_281258, partial [Backusella circina FSU 941]
LQNATINYECRSQFTCAQHFLRQFQTSLHELRIDRYNLKFYIKVDKIPTEEEGENGEHECKGENYVSFSSYDYTPKATTKDYIILCDNEDDNKDEEVQVDEKWFIKDIELTEYPTDFRKESLQMNETSTDHRFSTAYCKCHKYFIQHAIH